MKTMSKLSPLKMVFIGILFAAIFSGIYADAAPPPKNIILISWDGAQRNHVKELLKAGKLPNIAALRDEGKIIPINVTTHQTDTKAGHTQMLTGYKPDVTGVFNDKQFGPVPQGLSIFERLENGLGPDNILTIMLTAKTHNLGSLPEGEYEDPKDKKMKWQPAEPWFNAKPNIDLWQGDKIRTADEVGLIALDDLKTYAGKRFFLFIHFSDPDSAGHMFGENSAQYTQAIITCDQWLGKIRKALKEAGLEGETLIYVNADHGFDEGQTTHNIANQVFLATNDSGITASSGDQMDIVPTLLKREGLDPASMSPPLPGKPLF
jgi:predicted AlkP superfamily pyrophosphatase or phosphodiesterase